MDKQQIITSLDEQIGRLQRARDILTEDTETPATIRRSPTRSSKGGITAAGRKRLSRLMKQRWAARRKTSKKLKAA